jgi:predicted transcriptional regulator of viral defense system
MKVTKQEAQGTKSRSLNHVAGKKFKNISLRKTESRIEIDQNEGAVLASPRLQQKGTEPSKIKHADEVNTIPPGHQQDSINVSTETPVLLSSDGILRQVISSLALFKHKTFRKLCVLWALIFKSIFHLCFLRIGHVE